MRCFFPCIRKIEFDSNCKTSGRSSPPDTQACIFMVHHPFQSPSHPGNPLSFKISIRITSSGGFFHFGLLYFVFSLFFFLSPTLYIFGYSVRSRGLPTTVPRAPLHPGPPRSANGVSLMWSDESTAHGMEGHSCLPLWAPWGAEAVALKP